MITPGFIEAGLVAIRDALETAAERAGLIVRRHDLTIAAARAFRSKCRALETMLRRLIVLMAAGMEVETARDESPLTPARAGASSSQTAPSEACARQPRHRGFTLLPDCRFDPEALERLRARPRAAPKAPGFVPLLHRYRTLLLHLANPQRLARRMARHLAASKAAGDPRPLCLPQPGLHRLDRELGAIAALLPDAVRGSLAGWYDSG
jgi:hypothetical protein